MTTKNNLSGIIFLSGVLFMFHFAIAQGNKTFEVKYISANNIYLNAGTTSGLAIGDTLQVSRGGEPVARIEVKYTAEYSSSCQILTAEGEIRPGDKATLISQKEKPVVIVSEPEVQDEAKPAPTKPSPAASRRGRYRSPFSGTISLQYYAWSDLSEAGLDFSQPTLRLSLRGRELWGKPYNLRIRARLRHNQRARPLHSNAPEQEWRNRIYEISFSYDNKDAAFNYQIGRIISSKFSGIGYIDGGLLQYNITTALRAGVFGGAQPQWQYADFQTSIQKYGAYLNYVSGDYSRNRYESTLAFAGEYHGSTVSREFVYIQNSLFLQKQWTIFQSAELDINRSWRKEISGDSFALTNLFISAQWRLSRLVTLGLMYDNRKNYLTYETRTFVEDLFDEALRQGLRGTVTVILPKNYRIFGNAGIRKRDTDSETTKSFAGGISKINFLIPNMRLFINGAGFSNFYTSGMNYSLMAGRYLMNRVNLDLGYGSNQYSLKAQDTNRVNHWIRANLLGDLIHRFFWSGLYEYNWGDDLKGHRILFEIGYRL